MSLLVLGTVALDTINTPSGKRNEILGGSASHFAMSARFFTDVNLVSNVGNDFSKKHWDFLVNRGINLNSVIRSDGRTFRWKGKYVGDLNSAVTLDTQLGVLSILKPSIDRSQKSIKNIFLANVDPDIQVRFLTSIDRPRLVGLDSMNYWIMNKRSSLLKVLKNADIFIANDTEARQLTGITNLISAAKKLHKMGPAIIVIKKGEHGALYYFDGTIYCLPAYPIEKIIDPTGAGDTFAGGFMGYLSIQKKISAASIKQALVYGIIFASFNVEGFGLEKTSRLTFPLVKKRLFDFKRKVEW